MGVQATIEDVQAAKAQRVIVATGATMTWPRTAPQSWREDGVLLDARAAARELCGYRRPQGGTALLFDMDHTEATYALAEVMQRLFDRTVIVTPRERIAADVPLVSNLGIYRRLTRLGVEILPLSEIARWNRPLAGAAISSAITSWAPELSPKMVTLPGSPPKAAILSCTH